MSESDSPTPVVERHDAEGELRAQLARDVRAGLTARPKSLPPKYFYDAAGSRLFEAITRLEEYYPTRAETRILEERADEIMSLARPDELVEIGSGSSRKTTLLLEAMHAKGGTRYVPIDVSESALREAARTLVARYPWLEVAGVVGDYERGFPPLTPGARHLVAFLGSTIGNFEPDERLDFLQRIRDLLGTEDRFLLGMDLVKDTRRLEAAYDDAAGVTAEFNLNVLRVINRELGAEFPLDAFAHVARYDTELQRIEMRLRATRPVEARIPALDLVVRFEADEDVLTEISCKFTREGATGFLAEAGFEVERWYTDPAGDFALALLRPR